MQPQPPNEPPVQPQFDPTQFGVSPEAMARLNDGRGEHGVFTSDLTVKEFLLVRQAGFRPLGFVLGTSIYHVGLQVGNWTQNMELTVLSQAMYQARELAMTRMEAEAYTLGADGIVGVHLAVHPRAWGEGIAEFIAIGTAVRADKPPENGQWRNVKNRPFTSALTGSEFWTLLKACYAPVGLTMGTCVYHVAHQRMGQMMRNMTQNVEIPQFTQAVYDAREIAMGRMYGEAHQLQAEGVVGFKLEEHNHVWGHHATEFFSFGTAVRPLRPDHEIPEPDLTLLVG
jgi:uncharacterized protein YbjQ (UPF0145 family)